MRDQGSLKYCSTHRSVLITNVNSLCSSQSLSKTSPQHNKQTNLSYHRSMRHTFQMTKTNKYQACLISDRHRTTLGKFITKSAKKSQNTRCRKLPLCSLLNCTSIISGLQYKLYKLSHAIIVELTTGNYHCTFLCFPLQE